MADENWSKLICQNWNSFLPSSFLTLSPIPSLTSTVPGARTTFTHFPNHYYSTVVLLPSNRHSQKLPPSSSPSLSALLEEMPTFEGLHRLYERRVADGTRLGAGKPLDYL